MSHLYKNTTNRPIRKHKIKYFAPNTWRLMHLIKQNDIYNTLEKKFFLKSTKVPAIFIGYETLIHSGYTWKRKRINKWMVGMPIGEFVFTKKIALYKSKMSRKKK